MSIEAQVLAVLAAHPQICFRGIMSAYVSNTEGCSKVPRLLMNNPLSERENHVGRYWNISEDDLHRCVAAINRSFITHFAFLLQPRSESKYFESHSTCLSVCMPAHATAPSTASAP